MSKYAAKLTTASLNPIGKILDTIILVIEDNCVNWASLTASSQLHQMIQHITPAVAVSSGTRTITTKPCPLLRTLTDARECILCSGDYWSNDAHDACVPKIIEFLAFGEPLGITLIVISAFGALVTIAVGVRITKRENLPSW